jgi:hypothetical protein
MPKLVNCCFCPNKTGAIIIGAIGTLFCTIGIVFAALELSSNTTTYNNIQLAKLIGQLIGDCIGLLLNISLVIGAKLDIIWLYIPWLFMSILGIFILGVTILTLAIMSVINGAVLSLLLLLVIGGCFLGLNCYLTAVVFNAHKEIAQHGGENDPEDMNRTNLLDENGENGTIDICEMYF